LLNISSVAQYLTFSRSA